MALRARSAEAVPPSTSSRVLRRGRVRVTPEIAALALAAAAGVVATLLLILPWQVRRSRLRFEAGRAQAAEVARAEQRVLEERIETRERDVQRARTHTEVLEAERDRLAAENRQLAEQAAALAARKEILERQLEQVGGEIAQVREAISGATRREAELRTRLAEAERTFAEREASFERTGEMLKQQFQLLAQRIFEEQGNAFARNNRTQLDGVLSPLREQLSEFKQKVEQVYVSDARDRASLLTEIKNLQSASERVNVEAENLAKALKGDKKLQGNWGELVLERVLEQSGLRRDHEYSVQPHRRDELGDSKRPDVIIHLPDEKDIVIDSKVSLLAYERALAATEETERDDHLRQHVADLRSQIRRLSEQDYDRLLGIKSLDFVLLFLPIESAFTLAMQHDAGLFTEAFSRRIVIVSPTTLMMTLRIIHNVWRYEKQSRNAQEIAGRAGALYDKLRVAMEDMARLGSALQSADSAYGEAMKKLASGKGNLVRQVEQLRELGAPVKRAFPRELLDDSDDAAVESAPEFARCGVVEAPSGTGDAPPDPIPAID
jgi:DNA recombination protein RmuC